MPNDKATKIIKRFESLYNLNANWRDYYEELADFCLPRKAWINSPKTRGEKLKFNFLYDSTAIRGLKIMAAGFHSNLTNPASKWFNLRTRDLKLMEFRDVQLWFKEVEDIIIATLNSSNFDSTMQEFYLSAGCFGTGTILTLEDFKDKVRFTEIPVEQVSLEEDSNGRIVRVYRRFKYTAQQAFDLWGVNAGPAVTEVVEKHPEKDVYFLHCVGPRAKSDASKEDNVNMPYESIWIEISKKHLIEESGFLEFPYSVGRFYKDPNDVLGYSPAMDVLADIKLLNQQTKTMLRAAMKQSDPALMLPDKGFILPLNLNPGATNYRKKSTNADDLSVIPSNGNIPITLEVMDRVSRNIDKAFFVPLFQALSDVTKQMTIPEVQRRISENMVLLGPVVGRFTQEVLDPIIVRVFSILLRLGELPVPPLVLQPLIDLDIAYISPLARSQREGEVFSIESFLADVNAIASTMPMVLDKIDGDKVIDIIAKVKGISPDLIRSDKDVGAIRDARAEVAQAQAQAQALAQTADTVETGTKAAKNLEEK